MNKLVLALILATLTVFVAETSISKEPAPRTVVLSRSNSLSLNGEINGDTTAAIIASAKELDNNMSGFMERRLGKKPIYLFLNSPGGSIQSGLEIIEALKGLGRPVDTVTMFATSMAWQLAQNLDDRLILKNGVLMSHHAAGEMSGSFGGVHPSQMDNRIQLWLDRVRELDQQTVKRTNGKQTYESYINQYDHEMWLTGTKAVDQGYADEIVLVKCDKSLAGTTKHQLNFMGAEISYELDNCPLNTAPLNIKIGAKAGVPAEYLEIVKNQFLSAYRTKAVTPLPMVF
jgi:ATP-dependent Clp protease, protease subunit